MKSMTSAISELQPHIGDTKKMGEVVEEMVRLHLLGDEIENIGAFIASTYSALPEEEKPIFENAAPNTVKLIKAAA